jgi:hypothetical protein
VGALAHRVPLVAQLCTANGSRPVKVRVHADGSRSYRVRSGSKLCRSYGVDPAAWSCSCPDHRRRQAACKHALACWLLERAYRPSPVSHGTSEDAAASARDTQKYVTPAEAAELLGVGASAVREQIRRVRMYAEKDPGDGRGKWRIPLDVMLRAGRGTDYSALILTELVAQRVAELLRQELSSPDPEIANNHDQNELFKTICGLSERIAKREIAERDVKRLEAELAELRS